MFKAIPACSLVSVLHYYVATDTFSPATWIKPFHKIKQLANPVMLKSNTLLGSFRPERSCGCDFNISPPRTTVFLTGGDETKGATSSTQIMHWYHRIFFPPWAVVAWCGPSLHPWRCGRWVSVLWFTLSRLRGWLVMEGAAREIHRCLSANIDTLLP